MNNQSFLKKYSHSLTRPMANLERFSRIAPYLIMKLMKLSGASFVVLDREACCYRVRAGEGNATVMVGTEIPEDSVLIQELISTSQEINLAALNKTIKALPGSNQRLKWLETEMKHFKAELIIPVISESEHFNRPTMLAALILGPKKSNEPFSKEDLNFLKRLANQATMTIEYTFIFEELKRSQEQLINSEKLATLGRTVAGIAHELKNPLTYLQTIAESIDSQWSKPSFKKQLVNIFPSEVERMKLLIEGLSDYSKEHELRLEAVELVKVIEKVLAILSYEINNSKVELIMNLPPDTDIFLALADKDRIVQVFMNIIHNALQAMRPDGGKLIITFSKNENAIMLSIADSGPGIKAEILKQIFDPFFTTKASGTGLGLSITKKIIDEHNGSIAVESQPGKGTTFFVHLPAASSRSIIN